MKKRPSGRFFIEECRSVFSLNIMLSREQRSSARAAPARAVDEWVNEIQSPVSAVVSTSWQNSKVAVAIHLLAAQDFWFLSVYYKRCNMTGYEREHLAAVINFFWGKGTATPDSINKRVAEVAYRALKDSRICTRSLDLVPRPTGAKPGISYVVSELVQIGRRILSGNTSIYDMCKVKVGANYKTEIIMALGGV